MDFKKKLTVLNKIYQIYHRIIEKQNSACEKYCDHCCTVNVTLTSLETYGIINNMEKTGQTLDMTAWPNALRRRRFQPNITTNGFATLCMKGMETPPVANESSWGNCPILKEKMCPIYDYRPFGCRCMVSKFNCGETGYADMDDWMVSVNTVFMQYIEHVDADGFFGNLTDMFNHMDSDENRRQYRASHSNIGGTPLISNQNIPLLMIPPEHKDRLSLVVNTLNNIKSISPSR